MVKNTSRKMGRPSLAAQAEKADIEKAQGALNKVALKKEQCEGIEKVVTLLEKLPELVDDVVEWLTKAEADRKPGGLLEKWPRNYYRLYKIGPLAMLAFMKKLPEGDAITAAQWVTIQATKLKEHIAAICRCSC